MEELQRTNASLDAVEVVRGQAPQPPQQGARPPVSRLAPRLPRGPEPLVPGAVPAGMPVLSPYQRLLRPRQDGSAHNFDSILDMLEEIGLYSLGCKSTYLFAEDKETVLGLLVSDATDSGHVGFFLPGGKIIIHGSTRDPILSALAQVTDMNPEPPKRKKKKTGRRRRRARERNRNPHLLDMRLMASADRRTPRQRQTRTSHTQVPQHGHTRIRAHTQTHHSNNPHTTRHGQTRTTPQPQRPKETTRTTDTTDND